ncbi:hypothetical protein [Rudanella lutea]|jgi:hypothetical protein|uniref:hypothetical protein n=1 Tax=Rudanella lutea TaxID=451374 RepID=UPI00037DABA7|nr:hypothetical protein [Rudanella lutea]
MKKFLALALYWAIIIACAGCKNPGVATQVSYAEVILSDFSKVETYELTAPKKEGPSTAVLLKITGNITQEVTFKFYEKAPSGSNVLIFTRVFPKGSYDGNTDYRSDYYNNKNVIMEIRPTIPMTGSLKIKWGIV